ncbi:MAG: hypothetical protein ACTHYV_06830 [Psychroflexus sp.]|uniref:hypothetical protein n=1 Tax=Psychroflexus sp. S27 TaxID=1982757 RepID=UPI000C2AD624|nr:hypothetical protein [Psychroflexus sp. S27]PJX21552.1 hypothetical protein CAP47_07860 [Psychroflexus sp. S27]
MKKLNTIVLLLFIGTFFMSCSSDDDAGSVTENYFEVDGTRYEFKDGMIINFRTYAGNSNFDISLTTSDIQLIEGEPMPQDDVISGVYFEIFTVESNKIPTGTYTYALGDENAGTFSDYSELVINGSYSNNDAELVTPFNSGMIEVLQNGPVYELNFDVTTIEGKKVTGYFKGNLYEIDDSASKPGNSTSKKLFSKE